MAVDVHPSRKPGLPRKPPATSTTDGQPNTVSKTMTGAGMMEYGSRNGKDLRVTAGHGTDRASDFMPMGANSGKAPKAGKEASNEGPKGKASRPGSENSADEPG
jgi:hypothetical protein